MLTGPIGEGRQQCQKKFFFLILLLKSWGEGEVNKLLGSSLLPTVPKGLKHLIQGHFRC